MTDAPAGDALAAARNEVIEAVADAVQRAKDNPHQFCDPNNAVAYALDTYVVAARAEGAAEERERLARILWPEAYGGARSPSSGTEAS